MAKNIKKTLASLGIAMLISTSVGHAQSYVKYNNYSNYNGYDRIVYTFNSNNYYSRFNNISIRFMPSYWTYENSNNQTAKTKTPVKEETPSKENNTNTDTNINIEKPNTNLNTENNANTSVEMEIVNLVNIERQKEGLAPLQYSSELSKVARAKSQDMASKNYFSHNSPTYGDPFTMMRTFGIQYKTAGENIAKGYLNAQSVMKGWMNSSGHRANILNPSFGKIGVGYVNINGTTYWTQMFTD